MLPAHTQLKYRKSGQTSSSDLSHRDLRAELLAAEAFHFEKKKSSPSSAQKHLAIEGVTETDGESHDSKRAKILQETRDIDADESLHSSSSEESDSEDETADLIRELEKIKRERAAEKAKQEAELAEKRNEEIAHGNPLLNASNGFNVKRRWDDDVVFKNQGGKEKKDKGFINDLLRSEFHKKFLGRYVK